MSRLLIDDLRLTIDDWIRPTNDGCSARSRFRHRLPGSNRQSSIVNRQSRRAFTLIETALATIIVGVGVLAIVAAYQAFHQQNNWSTNASIAQRLGNEIREMTLNLPRHDPVTGAATWGPESNETWLGAYDDLDDFDGTDGNGWIFSAADGNGPINARREVIANMPGWSQIVRVFNVDPTDITANVTDASTNTIKMEVQVLYQSAGAQEPMVMTTVWWIAPK